MDTSVVNFIGVSPWPLTIAVCMMGSGALIGLLFIVPLTRNWLLPRYRDNELVDWLPFGDILRDHETMRMSDGTLAVTIKIGGVATGSLDKSERTHLLSRRKAWLDLFAKEYPGVFIRILSPRLKFLLSLKAESGHETRDEILKRWNAQFEQSFRNEHYVVLSVAGGTDAARIKLHRAVDRTITALAGLNPEKITHGHGEYSELLTLWAQLVNPVNVFPVGKSNNNLAKRLWGGPVDICRDTGLIRWRSGAGREMYGYFVVSYEWGDESDNELLSRILAVDGELVIMQRIDPVPAMEADLRVEKKSDWSLMTKHVDTTEGQFKAARNMLAEGAQNQQRLMDYELVVLVMGDSREEAARVATKVEECFFEIGARPAIDTDTAQVLWFGLFPSYNQMVRDCSLMSQNVAEFMSFEATPTGLAQTPWGPGAMMTVKTDQGTPYQLNTHVSNGDEAAGDFVIIGDKGGGKTTLIEMLTTGSLNFLNLRAFLFDSNLGMLPWTLFSGGRYLGIGRPLPGFTNIQLQPFLLDPSPENRLHINQLFHMLTGLNDAESDRYFGAAIQNWAGLKGPERRLEIVVNSAFEPTSNAYKQIFRWIDPKQYGHIFESDQENIPIDDKSVRHFVFDMTAVLKDARLGPVMIFDLLHRIDQLAMKLSCPILIILDEAAFMLANPLFREFFLDWIAQKRKRRFVIGIVLQTPDQLDSISPDLSARVRQLMPTWIVLPNPNAELAKYKDWKFTDREKLFIKGRLSQTDHMQYPILLKKNTGESVFLETVNHCLGEYASIFKSGDLSVKAAMDAFRVDSVNPLNAYLMATEKRRRA